MTLAGLGLLTSLVFRSTMDVNVLHDRSPVFVALADGGVRNGYTIKLVNMERAPHRFTLKVDGVEGARLDLPDGQPSVLDAAADSVATYRVYVSVPAGALRQPRADINFVFTRDDGKSLRAHNMFAGPN